MSTFHLVAGLVYVTVYERVRTVLRDRTGVHDHAVRSLVAGGCASAVNQTIAVPCDVISQYMMTLGRKANHTFVDPLNLMHIKDASKLRLGKLVCQEVWRQDGIRGFYRFFLFCFCRYLVFLLVVPIRGALPALLNENRKVAVRIFRGPRSQSKTTDLVVT